MNERQVSEGVAAWLGEIVGAAGASTFAYPVGTVGDAAFPICAAVVDRKRTAPAVTVLEFFPMLQLQQHAWVRVFECSGSVMTGLEENEAGALAAFQELQGYGAALETSLHGDDTLGGRVPFASPVLILDYSPVFQELDDGTRGRTFAVDQLIVGELIAEPDPDPS